MIRKTLFVFFVFFIPLQLFAQNWQILTVDYGVKPAIGMGDAQKPHIAYMTEVGGGYVRHTLYQKDSMSFDTSTVKTGYFYGPLNMIVSQDDTAHIVFHDHNLNGGDESYAKGVPGGPWINMAVNHVGHDGWDNDIALDQNGYPHTSSIDPNGFSGNGLEYAYYDGVFWTKDTVIVESLNYAHGTSIALDSIDDPHIMYYHDAGQDLKYAYRKMGNWTVTAVDQTGDVGRFPSLLLDSMSYPHVSYVDYRGGNMGIIKYGYYDGSVWNFEHIDTLLNLQEPSARNVTSLYMDKNNDLHISYADFKIVKYAKKVGATWQIDTVADLNGTPYAFGQITSLVIDTSLYAHIAYSKSNPSSPVGFEIDYATNDTSIVSGINELIITKNNYLSLTPNPAMKKVTVAISLPDNDRVSLTLLDQKGRLVKAITKDKHIGTETSINVPLEGLPSGNYFIHMAGKKYADVIRLTIAP